MPWAPELFTAPALQRLLEKRRRDELVAVPFFDGLIAGEPDALVKSFAGEPELYDPVRGRIKGAQAFKAFVAQMSTWLVQRKVSVENVEHVVLEGRGFEEVVLHLDGDTGRVDLPFAIVADRPSVGRIDELRIYYSSRPLTGRHANRHPCCSATRSCATQMSWPSTSVRFGRRRRRDRRGVRAGRLRP